MDPCVECGTVSALRPVVGDARWTARGAAHVWWLGTDGGGRWHSSGAVWLQRGESSHQAMRLRRARRGPRGRGTQLVRASSHQLRRRRPGRESAILRTHSSEEQHLGRIVKVVGEAPPELRRPEGTRGRGCLGQVKFGSDLRLDEITVSSKGISSSSARVAQPRCMKKILDCWTLKAQSSAAMTRNRA